MTSLSSELEQASALLRLPLELRREIYRHVLPDTSAIDTHLHRSSSEPKRSEYSFVGANPDRGMGSEVVWKLGCTRLLAVNHQIHEECVDMIYGENTFVIHVAFDGIRFQYRWLVSSTNLTPKGTKDFLNHFSHRNLLRIRNYVVNIEHCDDYAGMLKYNCGGRGLAAGIRDQVQTLVDLLAVAPYLHRLHIHLIDGAIGRVRFRVLLPRVPDDRNFSKSQAVLEPFRGLYEVRMARVTGVSPEYAEALERSMTGSRVITAQGHGLVGGMQSI